MNRLRTPEEVNEVYRQRGEAGVGDKPYILDLSKGDSRLIFFGSRHSNDPHDPQWHELHSKWKQFLSGSNPHKLVLSEGGLRPVEGKTTKQVIIDYEEPGFVCWLAHHDGVRVKSPEPSKFEELEHMRQQGFNDDQIVLYYFARQMHQWNRSDHKTQPDWQVYADDFLRKVSILFESEIKLDRMLDIFQRQTDKDFSADDEKQLYDLSDPGQSPVSAASGEYRDEKLLQSIRESIGGGYDVFVVYGHGHAIRLEPALEELYAKKSE